MNANMAGIYGAQIFRRDDRPLYRRGFSVAIAVLSAGFALAIMRWVDDLLRRRRTAKAEEAERGGDDGSGAQSTRSTSTTTGVGAKGPAMRAQMERGSGGSVP